ncbi:CX3C chemokine receptor 1 [Scomber japonicus]|uniref:CX3C chemokine receptor 1 n=1 Tax=Scomber japonicus TaxID=13676 RepID=UPI002305F595|nr:CX3C chemokine receptor 1 [Scomber japonicus]
MDLCRQSCTRLTSTILRPTPCMPLFSSITVSDNRQSPKMQYRLWYMMLRGRQLCSMNTSENISYYDYYYDYNGSCVQDLTPFTSDGSVFLTVLFYTLFGLGLLGNTTVIWILLRYIKMKTMTDVCLLNLAVSDLILASSLPLWAYSTQNIVSCKLMTGIYQLGFYSGTLFVTLMSLDRYLAIVCAVAAMQTRTRRYGITASIIIWLIAVIMATPQVRYADIENNEGVLKCLPLYPFEWRLFWNMQRNFSENTLSILLCLPIMIFSYVNILVVLSKSRNSKKDRAVKLIFTVVCLFVLCWGPYNVTVFLKTLEIVEILGPDCELSKSIHSAMCFAEIIAASHCCVNPVIYALIGEKFRKSLRKMLSRYLCWSYQSRGAFSHRDTTDKETSNTPVKSDY